MVDTTKYKSIAIKIPYYDALVKMGMTAMRGPGQQMMHLIRKAADEEIEEDQEGGGATAIPKCWVKKIEYLIVGRHDDI